MAFSPIPAFYYAFYCDQATALIYISIIVITGLASFITSLIEWFNKKERFIFKAAILMCSSLASVVGLIHMITKELVYDNYGDSFSILPSCIFFIPCLLSYAMGFYVYVKQYF